MNVRVVSVSYMWCRLKHIMCVKPVQRMQQIALLCEFLVIKKQLFISLFVNFYCCCGCLFFGFLLSCPFCSICGFLPVLSAMTYIFLILQYQENIHAAIICSLVTLSVFGGDNDAWRSAYHFIYKMTMTVTSCLILIPLL